ncbi:alpha/beta hydrolase [Lentilactobacillus otakiensis]|nr:alpha/beta hydrolase [Lentilactobacillus otakiensis]KRL10220.1 esterase lipase [Lentilactobacillus otakiensis DSM 19908 = JCM 15040]MBZ3777325.1 alpha/beta hydrolase [Lentilactobacillus otakiensis]MDV3518584.1 alpha/beta hydrolase [Lentilactobacillus otakiensis]
MSFMAKRLINKFRSEDYKKSVAHSFLKPNQKINIFRQNESEYKIRPVKNGQVVTIEPIANPTSQILYFHGGAFTVPMNEDQLEMITRIATESASRIQVADFPLLPGHSADEILTFSQSALELVTDSELRTFIVADSAGAKIALQLLVNNPGKIAGTSLISPWLDMQLTDPEIAARADNDILLDLPTLQKIGGWFDEGTTAEQWVDFTDASQLKNIGDIQIFYGGNEMLVPSDLKFIKALQSADGTNPIVTEYRDGYHDYTLWFKLSETKKTFKRIAEFIKDRRDV